MSHVNMYNPSQINMFNSLQIHNSNHYILDNVLQDIDGLLMSELPLIPQNNGSNYSNAMAIPYNTYTVRPKIIQFEPLQFGNNSSKLQLKDYIFISKDCTQKLVSYIVSEQWGKDNGLLYKYIDYIFRCQTFKKEIIAISDKYLVLHTGLQRRVDKEFLYLLLVRNKKYNKKFVAQKWRVQYGNIKNSFLSKRELLSKFSDSFIIEQRLPKRTKFVTNLIDLVFDDSYTIDVNWEERISTNKDRIRKVFGSAAFFDNKTHTKFMKLKELTQAFDMALKETQRIAALNPRLCVPQAFVDTKHGKYRMELLLPLNVEFPKYSNNFYQFALAINKSSDQYSRKYIAKSILTRDMAYSNARLVGYVDSNWLKFPKNML